MTKISQLTDLGANLAAGDEFVVRDISDISTPNKKVTASGFVDYIIAQGVGSGFTQISAGATSPASVRCVSSGTTREVIVTTSGIERARFTTAGQLRMAGAGITFNGDTAATNELDDYEEGTWTPTVIGTATAGTVTYGTRTGRYTKVGRLVFVELRLSWSAGTGAGDLRISGLPFSSAGETFPGLSVGFTSILALTASHVATYRVFDASTEIQVLSYPTGGGTSVNVAYDAEAQVGLAGFYTV